MRNRIFLAAALLALGGCESVQIGGKTYEVGKYVQAGQNLSKAFYISPEEERKIGREAAASLAAKYGIYDDAALTRYVNLVGLALARKTQRKDVHWRFAVLNTSVVNAYSAPGGYVFITKGLLKLCQNEADLAGVLAHEIQHVDRNHVIDAVKKQFGAKGLGALTKENYKFAADIATGLVLNGYGKPLELEADKHGVLLASKVGYDPKGLPRALQAQHESSDAAKNASFTARHPAFADRMKALSSLDVPDTGATLKKRFLDHTAI